MKIWYAVQEQSSDGWDKGSYNIFEALAMLKEQGHGLIAAIDDEDSFCLDEYTYDELITEIDELRERSENYISTCEFEKSEQCLDRIDDINSWIDKVWGEKYRG